MRRARIAAVAAALGLLLASVADAAPPRAGVLQEGTSLGGVRIGSSWASVVAAWGPGYGRCRTCVGQTLYFNARPFTPQGAGVELRRGRVVAVFTLWAPAGWRTTRGLRIGSPASRATAIYGALPKRDCGSYRALVLSGGAIRTIVAIVDETVWGFMLLAAGEPMCR